MVILLAIREDANRCCLNRGIVNTLEEACVLLALQEHDEEWPEGFEALVVDTDKGTNQIIV